MVSTELRTKYSDAQYQVVALTTAAVIRHSCIVQTSVYLRFVSSDSTFRPCLQCRFRFIYRQRPAALLAFLARPEISQDVPPNLSTVPLSVVAVVTVARPEEHGFLSLTVPHRRPSNSTSPVCETHVVAPTGWLDVYRHSCYCRCSPAPPLGFVLAHSP